MGSYKIILWSLLFLAFVFTTESSDSELKILYENGIEVEYRKELTPTQVQNQPKIQWHGFKSDSYYTLIMYDPDAPSRSNPKASPFLHWLIVNIPGGDFSKGLNLAEYIGSGPPQGTGLHRYIFALYKQPNLITDAVPFATKTSRNGRPNFGLNDFVSKYHLGEVLTTNQYQAQWDDYVPILHKQLSNEQ